MVRNIPNVIIQTPHTGPLPTGERGLIGKLYQHSPSIGGGDRGGGSERLHFLLLQLGTEGAAAPKHMHSGTKKNENNFAYILGCSRCLCPYETE